MRKSIVTILAALSTLAALPAAAEDFTVSVSYADLDLTAPEGAVALAHRIDAAVGKACERPHLRDLKGMVAWEECKASAIAAAQDQLSVLEPYASIELASRF